MDYWTIGLTGGLELWLWYGLRFWCSPFIWQSNALL